MSDTLTIIKSTPSELSLTLATTINEMHSECMTVDNQLTMIVLQKINLVRECGVMLIEAKAQSDSRPVAPMDQREPDHERGHGSAVHALCQGEYRTSSAFG